ncbi:pep-cterm sorting domain-containing protein [Anaeramoeba ignava]|uniref:Pep-cterm sorting domain-containing protein n=1 Tax=Anaeramoeba ignava TaxID=1746090 RepID=A0A9Q0R6C5_ANAIG|nr:pep-cterm sorting domain-containing protein [Anaeramoeba ignava]
METYLNLEKLSNDLKNLFQNQNQNENENEESYFDFEIICEQNKTKETKEISFKTHKSILSSRSHYFKSLFNSKMKEYQENKLILKDVSSSILFSILNYFYSGKIEINLENAVEILFFSSKYLIDELIENCLKFIKNNTQIETVVDVLKLSESMHLNHLSNFCYKFIFENFDKFIKTPFFLDLEENHLNSVLSSGSILIKEFEMFQSIIKWGKHKSNINQVKENEKLEKEEKEKIKNQISNIIDKIRFIDFSKEEIEDILKQDLIPNQISEKLIEFQKLQNRNQKELKEFIHKENSLIFKRRMKFKSSIIEEKEYFKKLKEWINDDEFFFQMKRRFSAKKEGFSYKTWHEKCDNKGKTLIIIKTKENYIFGGFTSVGFLSDETKWSIQYSFKKGCIKDEDAFLFSIKNPRNDPPQKFPIRKGEEDNAIMYHLDYGPIFGYSTSRLHDDIWLYENLQGYTNFGCRYTLPNGIQVNTNQAKNYLAGSYHKWKADELECFMI